MRVTSIVLLAFIAEAQVLGKLGYQTAPSSFRTSQGRFNAVPSRFTPEQDALRGRRNPLMPHAMADAIYDLMPHATDDFEIDSPEAALAHSIAPFLKKKSSTKTKSVSEAAASAADWPMLNAFDLPLQSCGPGEHFCTFNSNAPAICVAENANAPISWSDAEAFRCVSIWDSGSRLSDEMASEGKDLHVKCDALPSEIFHSQFTLQKWQNCEVDSSEKCEAFTQSMEYICNTCMSQANTLGTKGTLASKCKEFSLVPAEMFTQTFPDISSIAVVMMVISGLTFAMFRLRRRASKWTDEPLLGVRQVSITS